MKIPYREEPPPSPLSNEGDPLERTNSNHVNSSIRPQPPIPKSPTIGLCRPIRRFVPLPIRMIRLVEIRLRKQRVDHRPVTTSTNTTTTVAVVVMIVVMMRVVRVRVVGMLGVVTVVAEAASRGRCPRRIARHARHRRRGMCRSRCGGTSMCARAGRRDARLSAETATAAGDSAGRVEGRLCIRGTGGGNGSEGGGAAGFDGGER